MGVARVVHVAVVCVRLGSVRVVVIALVHIIDLIVSRSHVLRGIVVDCHLPVVHLIEV